MIKKLRSRAGETITETLVALLIAALALTMLAGAVTTASAMVTKSRTTVNNYQDVIEQTILAEGSGSGGTTGSVKFTEIKSSPETDVTIALDDESIKYYEVEAFKRHSVMMY